MSKLAIVIPAYKIIFFEEVLKSISLQTSKNFTVYIGNDNSPYDFGPLINKYANSFSLKYYFFPENLGGRNLISHWERCIDLVQDEEWIWLFSDDDIMEPECVENFYRTIEIDPAFDLLHFNVSKIDSNNNIIENCKKFSSIYSIENYLKDRLTRKIQSYVIEYIFRKAHFYTLGRFEIFDLGWGSDDATWIKLGKAKGIKTIENSKIFWRESDHNISPNFHDAGIMLRKFMAQIEYTKWILKMQETDVIDIDIQTLKALLNKWFLVILQQGLPMTHKSFIQVYSKFYSVVYASSISNVRLFQLILLRNSILLKMFIKKKLFKKFQTRIYKPVKK